MLRLSTNWQTLAAILIVASYAGACQDLTWGVANAASSPPLRTYKGIVVSDHAAASQVGVGILNKGGNAMDAAAATALALGVINPSSSGIGGGGFALVYDARRKRTYVIDFREIAPLSLTPKHFIRNGKVNSQLSRRGGLAVGVPGEIAGLELLVSRYGKKSWRQIVGPAQRLATRGFEVSWFLGRAATYMTPFLAPSSELRKWLMPRGRLISANQILRNPKLGWALSQIARKGRNGFYAGPVANDLVQTVKAHGGVLSKQDLRTYQPAIRTPISSTWRGKRIVTMPLPSSGGIALLETLGIIEASGTDLAAMGHSSSTSIHLISEALKHAFADRARLLGDDASSKQMVSTVLSKRRLAALAKRIVARKVLPQDQYGDRKLGKTNATPKDGGTSHLCVIDRAGNAVSLTTTVNTYFGSTVMTPRSGIVLNNEIDDFAIVAGKPNAYGLVQSRHNLVGPGKRPLSSMSPTLVFEGDRVVGCFGGSGGPRIISNVIQTILNVYVFGMDASEAVSAPRVHHQWLPNRLLVESSIPVDVTNILATFGHTIDRHPWAARPTAVQAIVVDGNTKAGASDPRKRGKPAAQSPLRH